MVVTNTYNKSDAEDQQSKTHKHQCKKLTRVIRSKLLVGFVAERCAIAVATIEHFLRRFDVSGLLGLVYGGVRQQGGLHQTQA